MNDPESVQTALKVGLVIMSVMALLTVILSGLMLFWVLRIDKRVKALEGTHGVAELLKLYSFRNGIKKP